MSRAARPATPLPPADPAFAELKALIVAETGHHYYEDKDGQLWERIAKRMQHAGIATAGQYLERLRDPAMGPREWRQLEGELTIKETFFFRFAEQFTALRERILPDLIAARGETRRLRIWSAGCSTGAEAYSLAVIVRDLLGAAIEDWHVSILGTDIDEAALAAAREGVYSGWALRVMAGPERERLFTTDGTRWKLRPAYRAMVRFERLNILDLLGPAAPLQLSDYDLILCRNMLIYFRPDVATRLIGALGDRLREDGLLLLGHAETGLAIGSGLDGRSTAGIVVYHRPGATIAADAAPAAEPPLPKPRAFVPPRRAPRRPPARSVKPAAPVPAPGSDLDAVRRLLDAGKTADARALIASFARAAPADPVLLYLSGVGAAAEGDRAGAVRALRGALYLDAGFAMAHYLLGQLLSEAGRRAEARRSLQNAANALAGVDPATPIAEGDGRTAADLRDAVRHQLKDMPA